MQILFKENFSLVFLSRSKPVSRCRSSSVSPFSFLGFVPADIIQALHQSHEPRAFAYFSNELLHFGKTCNLFSDSFEAAVDLYQKENLFSALKQTKVGVNL